MKRMHCPRRLSAALLILLMLCVLPQGEARAQMRDAAPTAVALLGSFSECWLLAGGELLGTTQDAIDERGLALPSSAQIVGTTKSPNLELILALDPDYALLSSEIAGHVQIGERLEAAGIHCLFYAVNTYQDYMDMMRALCELTGREDAYLAQVETVQAPIEALTERARAMAQAEGARTALLVRAYSGGANAKNSENMAGAMLRDMGLVNIADGDGALLENLSMESIILADPDCIFITTMGADEQAALDALAKNLTDQPAWSTLTAVQAGRVYLLPKDLFHYKPNARWPESYQYLEAILYPAPALEDAP